MTTKVTVKCEQTNGPTGKMIVGVGSGSNTTTELCTPPFEREHYVHGNVKVFVREASEQDIAERDL